jgi:rhodanese-related sulfurtransferase
VIVGGVGGRAHNAVRLLRQHGFNAVNISGGYTIWRHMNPVGNNSQEM